MPSVALFSSPVIPFCLSVTKSADELTLPSRLQDPIEAFPADASVAGEPLNARPLYPARDHGCRELRQHERTLSEQCRRRLRSLSRGVWRVRDVLEAGPDVSLQHERVGVAA